jgi:hypothetical protein
MYYATGYNKFSKNTCESYDAVGSYQKIIFSLGEVGYLFKD